MSRLIYADKLMEVVMATCLKEMDVDSPIKGMIVALGKIYKASTVDAVPVVRCKDCRWGKEACGNIECNVDLNLPSEYHGYEWFCPNGERKDDE